jgi:hypothetical protein
MEFQLQIGTVSCTLVCISVVHSKFCLGLLEGDSYETDNRMTSIARQQILNKHEQTAAARERLGEHVPVAKGTHAAEE